MATITTTFANLLLSFGFSAAAVTRPTAWYLALHTADPSVTGMLNEVSAALDTAYTRRVITLGAPSGGIMLNSGVITFPVAALVGAAYTATHLSIHDALTAGNALAYAPLKSTAYVVNGTATTFGASSIQLLLA